jgi:peptidoglycan-associated lipoprotein
VTVEGNCDERGSREYNLALGQRRADGVKNAMTLMGVPERQIETVSFGEEKPRASGHDEEAWAQNRRSDIVYRKID